MAELWFARRVIVFLGAVTASVAMTEHNIETGNWFGGIMYPLIAMGAAISLWFEPRK